MSRTGPRFDELGHSRSIVVYCAGDGARRHDRENLATVARGAIALPDRTWTTGDFWIEAPVLSRHDRKRLRRTGEYSGKLKPTGANEVRAAAAHPVPLSGYMPGMPDAGDGSTSASRDGHIHFDWKCSECGLGRRWQESTVRPVLDTLSEEGFLDASLAEIAARLARIR